MQPCMFSPSISFYFFACRNQTSSNVWPLVRLHIPMRAHTKPRCRAPWFPHPCRIAYSVTPLDLGLWWRNSPAYTENCALQRGQLVMNSDKYDRTISKLPQTNTNWLCHLRRFVNDHHAKILSFLQDPAVNAKACGCNNLSWVNSLFKFQKAVCILCSRFHVEGLYKIIDHIQGTSQTKKLIRPGTD